MLLLVAHELPEVEFCLRVFSSLFVRFRNSFVSRENSVFLRSMSSFSFTVFRKCSVGFSFSSPCTIIVFCLSLLSSLSCLAFILLISSACILICFSWAATVPFILVSSSCWCWKACWNCCLVEFMSAFRTSRRGFTAARICLEIIWRSVFVRSGFSWPGTWVAMGRLSAMLFTNKKSLLSRSALTAATAGH